ncbi:MAG: hypothetical protein AAF828_00285 [Bacteroidota bacterium]
MKYKNSLSTFPRLWKSLMVVSVCCLLLLATSCQQKGSSAQTPAPAATAPTPATYESIPLERLQHLWNNATYMDVVFYELPFSLNQSSLDAIRSTLAHIAADAPTILPECKSIGRIFFQVDGKNVETAEIYFQQGCTFYLWLENDKPAYANEFTEGGVAFYNNIIQSGTQGAQQ